MTTYTVSADHIVPRFSCKDAPVRIGGEDFGSGPPVYYASIAGYGCSKNYSTPERAIQGMLHEHGCTNIRIIATEP